jgi:hypothetical protein
MAGDDISLFPVENRDFVEASMRDEDRSGVPNVPLEQRGITLEVLADLLGGEWSLERRPDGFAFLVNPAASQGALYGREKDGRVIELHLDGFFDEALLNAWTSALIRLGARYDLALEDWRLGVVVDLRDASGLDAYLRLDREWLDARRIC